MLKRRRIIENGTMYDADVPFASAANRGKAAVVDDKGDWTFGEGGGSGSGLPDVTAADNGKVLGVVNAEWDAMNVPSDTLVCTFTYDSVNDTYTCDKTIAEMMAAFNARKNVIAFVPYDVYGTFKLEIINAGDSYVALSAIYTTNKGENYFQLMYFSLFGVVQNNADAWRYIIDFPTINDAPSASLNNGTLTIG